MAEEYTPDEAGTVSRTRRVRVSFDEDSYIDFWFAENTLRVISARDIKEWAHRITSTVMEEVEVEEQRRWATPKAGNGKTSPVIMSEARGSVASTQDTPADTPLRGGAALHLCQRDEKNLPGTTSTSPMNTRSRQKPYPVVVRSFQAKRPQSNTPPHGADSAASGGGTEILCTASADARLGTPSGPVLAYRACLRRCSIVLHFRAKGLRPGAFLFLAKFERDHDTARDAGADPAVPSRTAKSRVHHDGNAAGTWECTGNSIVVGEPEPIGSEDLHVNGLAVPDSARGSENGTCGRGNGSGEQQEALWVTDESTPLLPALRMQWVTSDSTPAAGADFAGDDDDRERSEESESPAALSLWIVSSARAPLPALCCGVCGSSWETDSFGKRYRTYHIAVANNASLVWYVQRRCSEFLALHAGLARGGKDGKRIPENRLPQPPSRTFGMMKLFPRKMERRRIQQLDEYMQELLSIPEALAHHLVLSFLGLLSTSRHDLMSTSKRRLKTRKSSSHGMLPTAPSSLLSALGAPSSHDRDGGKLSPRRASPSRTRSRSSSCPTATCVEALPRLLSSSSCCTSSRTTAVHERTYADSGHAVTLGFDATKARADGDEGDKGYFERGIVDEGDEGIVNSARTREFGYCQEHDMSEVVGVSTLEQAARGGDVVLFRCRGLLSRLQRWVFRSEWDHVGVVVSGGPDKSSLQLLESTREGVQLFGLVERIKAYQEQGFALRVAFRKLTCPNPAEARARLQSFARRAEGKAYGVSVLPLLSGQPKAVHHGRRTPHAPAFSTLAHPSAVMMADDIDDRHDHVVNNPQTSTPSKRNRDLSATRSAPVNSSYLCSQLVGAALSEMGLLNEGSKGRQRAWLWILPGAFGQGGSVERALADGVALGDEILLDGYQPEVASALLLGDP